MPNPRQEQDEKQPQLEHSLNEDNWADAEEVNIEAGRLTFNRAGKDGLQLRSVPHVVLRACSH